MNRIKDLRESRKETQKELADLLQTTQGTLSNWERGETQPDFETLLKIAKHYNVTIDYILMNDSDENHLRQYLTTKYGRVFTDSDLEDIEKLIHIMEHYKKTE